MFLLHDDERDWRVLGYKKKIIVTGGFWDISIDTTCFYIHWKKKLDWRVLGWIFRCRTPKTFTIRHTTFTIRHTYYMTLSSTFLVVLKDTYLLYDTVKYFFSCTERYYMTNSWDNAIWHYRFTIWHTKWHNREYFLRICAGYEIWALECYLNFFFY